MSNASVFVVEATLADIGDSGRPHPVQYASRMKNGAEGNYMLSDKEALAVDFALKNFKCFPLFREIFNLGTDHCNSHSASEKKMLMLDLSCGWNFSKRTDLRLYFLAKTLTFNPITFQYSVAVTKTHVICYYQWKVIKTRTTRRKWLSFLTSKQLRYKKSLSSS